MTPSEDDARAERGDGGSAGDRADPPVILAQLRWRLAGARQSAIRSVEECLVRVAALRRQVDDPALDVLLDGFHSVRAGLGALDPQRPIAPAEVEGLSMRLVALQRELRRYAMAIIGGGARGEEPTDPAPAQS